MATPALVKVPILPPFVVAAGIALGLVLSRLYGYLLPDIVPAPLGVRLLLVAPFGVGGLAVLRAARRELKKHGVHPRFQPVATLVTSGPFSYTRNPMYVGGTFVAAALAVALSNSAWVLLGALAPLLYLELLVIPREEAALAAAFGQDYATYCRDTPRWLFCFRHRPWRA